MPIFGADEESCCLALDVGEEAHRDAAEAAKRSSEPLLQYMVSCIYGLTAKSVPDDRQQAIYWLAKSLKADTAMVEIARNDGDLSSISDLEEFQRLIFLASELSERSKTKALTGRIFWSLENFNFPWRYGRVGFATLSDTTSVVFGLSAYYCLSWPQQL